MNPDAAALTPPIVVVLALIALTAYLFISERVRPDVAAILVLSLLGVVSAIPGFDLAIHADNLYSGFASDAVIAIIAVMVISAGLDRTGIMGWLAGWLLRIGGGAESWLIGLLCLSAGLFSAFFQNVGVIALFLPVVSRISARSGISSARLLMPVGFCTILGGTITLVGCSPLILLNELVRQSNRMLAPTARIYPFDLFATAPAGLALLAAGIALFLLGGRWLLPDIAVEGGRGIRALDYFKRVYGLDASLHEVVVPPNSPLVGVTIGEAQERHRVRIIATHYAGRTRLATPAEVEIAAPAVLAVIADPEHIREFNRSNGLRSRGRLETFFEALLHTRSGIAELVVPPDSGLIGKNTREVRMRETHGLTLLAIHRVGQSLRDDLPNIPFQAGDTLVCHIGWPMLRRLEHSRDLVVVTSEYPREEERPHKVLSAMVAFLLAMALVLFSEMRLGAAMLVGAVSMVLAGVLSMDEAYRAVSWKTVFLLAGLMPLGQAAQTSGAALWIAQQMLALLGGVPEWVLQAALALMASLFSLVVSNVGATILLVPIAMHIAVVSGDNPALYALIVALGTSNSFLIPTNQVNALIMGPGDYRGGDFVRVGGLMTVIFLVVSLGILNLLY